MISAIFQRNHDVIHLAGNLGGGGQGGQTVGKAPQLEEGEKQFSLLRTSSLTRLPCLFFLLAPHFALLFLLAIIPHHLLDGTNILRSVPLEVLDVQLLYNEQQRRRT